MQAWAYEYLTPITSGYLRSNSIRDCRLSNRRPPMHRVPARVGITGGYVAGAQADNSEFENKGESRRNKRSREYFAAK